MCQFEKMASKDESISAKYCSYFHLSHIDWIKELGKDRQYSEKYLYQIYVLAVL